MLTYIPDFTSVIYPVPPTPPHVKVYSHPQVSSLLIPSFGFFSVLINSCFDSTLTNG